MFKFCDVNSFNFIIEYLAHYDYIVEDCDIDLLYESIKDEYLLFETSQCSLQDKSHLQCIKDYFINL